MTDCAWVHSVQFMSSSAGLSIYRRDFTVMQVHVTSYSTLLQASSAVSGVPPDQGKGRENCILAETPQGIRGWTNGGSALPGTPSHR